MFTNFLKTDKKGFLAQAIKNLEAVTEKNKTIQNTLALAELYWVSYRLFGDIHALHKAMHLCTVMAEFNYNDLKLQLFKTFLALELDTNASALLDGFKGIKNYLKSNEPLHYADYCFLNGYHLLKNDKKRAALKFYNSIAELNKSNFNSHFCLCLGALDVMMGEYQNAYINLSNVYEADDRSPFLFVVAHIYFSMAEKLVFNEYSPLLTGFIKWALHKGVEISGIVSNLAVNNSGYLPHDLDFLEKVYKTYPQEKILSLMCNMRMSANDYSEKAYFYYKEAEIKQLDLLNFHTSLIKAAYLNEFEDISRYALEKYFKQTPIDLEILPFVLHLLLTNENNSDLLEKYKEETLNYAANSLAVGEKGRFYYTLYAYLIKERTDISLRTNAAQALYNGLFKFELTIKNPQVRYVWIMEREKKTVGKYTVLDEHGKVTISAVSKNFECMFFADNKQKILESAYRAVPLTQGIDISLLLGYFNAKKTSGDLLIALSMHYMDHAEPPDVCVDIYKQTLLLPELTTAFQMLVSAAIGNYYAYKNDHKTAVGYYNGIDLNCLRDRDIEKMLMAFIYAKEYKKAVLLIIKKAECISDKELFYSLKQLAATGKYDSEISDVAYEMILKSWYDKTLINIVINNYNGGQEEWQELSRSLASISIIDENLDTLIIKNTIWMHSIDKGSQNIFLRMYEMDPENPVITDFINYCIYETLINNIRLEYDTISIMEKEYITNRAGVSNRFLGYALSHVYINHTIQTFHSTQIIKEAATMSIGDGFIFPVFKKLKDKKLTNSYIEENQPFIYKANPEKIIKLYYRFDNEDRFRSKKMKYIGYGLYYAHLAHFFGEKITYYFSEEMPTGSITTKEMVIENTVMKVYDKITNYYTLINNALIYEQMFKYEKVEEIITEKLRDKPRIRSWII